MGGAGGHFVSWGAVLSGRGPNDKQTVSAVTRRHRGVLRNVLAHRNLVRVAHFSHPDNVGGFHPSFSRKSRFTVFGGVWAFTEIPGPNRQKKNDLKLVDFLSVAV